VFRFLTMKILATLAILALRGSSSSLALARGSLGGVREDESVDQHRYVQRTRSVCAQGAACCLEVEAKQG
jgi:hypothetical protein